jgi:hypothetical protein
MKKPMLILLSLALALVSCDTYMPHVPAHHLNPTPSPAPLPAVYEIPEGYRGWVLIQFESAGCDAIPTEDGKPVFRISSTGVLCTSSAPAGASDWEKDEYYFVGTSRIAIPLETQPGDGPKIRLLASTECFVAKGARGPRFISFFVGTEDEAKRDRSMPQPCAKR